MEKLMPCVRCNGTSHVPRENLHEGELTERIGEPLVFEYADDAHACPTCTPFGLFGMVPFVIAIEGGLIGKKPKTDQQIQRESWFDWMMN